MDGLIRQVYYYPEKGLAVGEPFQGCLIWENSIPGFSLRSNPGLKLANAFGVLAKFTKHDYFFFSICSASAFASVINSPRGAC